MSRIHDGAARIALALDVPDRESAERLVTQTRGWCGTYKIGLELYTATGPKVVQVVREAGAKCFLDLKLHDIPATVAAAVARASDLGVDYLTVHTSAGVEALRAAQNAAGSMQLLGVTVLTSLDGAALDEIGLAGNPGQAAERLAKLAWRAGIRGFVTSPHECAGLRKTLGPQAFLVTPGIRPVGAPSADQRRVATPRAAIVGGSDLLVVGRPIRDADDPGRAAEQIALQVQAALRQ